MSYVDPEHLALVVYQDNTGWWHWTTLSWHRMSLHSYARALWGPVQKRTIQVRIISFHTGECVTPS